MLNQNKKIYLSIGIPAFNEAGNIKSLLQNILNQKEVEFVLSEIIVVSDGSTDDTNKRVVEVADERIKLVSLEKRTGLCNAQNELVSRLTGDIVILLNADILPQHDTYLYELMRPILNEIKTGKRGKGSIGMVGSNYILSKPKSFIEKVLGESYFIKRDAAYHFNNQDNLYMSVGCARAFSREFIDVMHWEDVYGEDAFAYFMCIDKGFKFAYAKNAVAMFRVPPVLGDHIKQSKRYIASISNNKKYFGEDNVKRAYKIPNHLLLTAFVKHFFMHPILTVTYVLITAYRYASPRLNSGMDYLPHEEIASTKNLHSE